jgi:hypothetical protein
MNKQALIGIIVVCVLILGGVLFFVLKGGSSSSNDKTTSAPTMTQGTFTNPSGFPSISPTPSTSNLNKKGSTFYIQCPTTNQYIGQGDNTLMTSDIGSAQVFTVIQVDSANNNYLILSPNVLIVNNGNHFTIQYAIGSGLPGGGYIRASSDHINGAAAQYTCPACYICINGSCPTNQPVGSLNATTDVTTAYAARVPVQ